MNSRKIIHVLSAFPSKSETFIVNHVVECIDQGFNSMILANDLKSLEESSQKEILIKYKLINTAKTTRVEIPKNKLHKILKALFLLIIHINKAKVFFRILTSKKENSTLKLWYQAARFLEFKDDDVFHAHFGVNGVLLAKMKELGAIKGDIVVSFYGYDTFSTKEDREKIKNYYKELYLRVSLIHANSNYLFSNLKLLNVPQNKVFVNHVGVDQDIFKSKERIPNDMFNLITVGRLIELKGHVFGLELIKRLKEKGYNVHYNIVGDGDEMPSLVKKSLALGIEDNVTFHGVQSQQTILNLFYKNDLFLMTSITDSTGRAEGQGLVTAEAQATGIPAIGFDSGGVSETILHQKTGFIVPEKKIEALVEKVEILINDENLRLTYGRNAVSFVNENFNNKHQALKLINRYRNITKV
jgi:colanic acid/amylovoran biosynthesis glycosyltransferase